MRIWDIPVKNLCRKHLLGEHRELHALWTILTQNKKGYRNHPETRRWEGRLAALFRRHEEEVCEMRHRNYQHKSELDPSLATGSREQHNLINSIEEQKELLRVKRCACHV